MNRTPFAALLIVLAASACAGPPPPTAPAPLTAIGEDRNAMVDVPDPFGEDVRQVAFLDQGWSPEVSHRTYFMPQGSRLVPYAWFLALEQPDSRTPFRDDRNMARLRFLLQLPDAVNPDGLPIGFVREAGGPPGDLPAASAGDWLGLTCAACHTAQIDYDDVGYRIDGGPAMADIDAFLRDLADALRATRDDDAKLRRFAAAVDAAGGAPASRAPSEADLAALRAQLDAVIAARDDYNARNGPPAGGSSGHGRVDAFGAIFNEVLHRALPADERTSPTANTAPADAPVSYPPLWDTPYHDRVQWVGSALNDANRAGNLGRNVGEVLGVFGSFDIAAAPPPSGYPSSVNIANLQRLEADMATLWSPMWPEAFPDLDPDRVAAGKALYDQHCAACHAPIDRTDPNRRVVAKLVDAGTDPRTAANIWGRRSRTGVLEGRPIQLPPSPDGPGAFGAEAPGGQVVGHVVAGIVGPALQAQARQAGIVPPTPDPAKALAPTQPGTRYKARPLNGVWATAPYLHNGSVPTLYHLLLPPGERPLVFHVGSRAFDPVHVGFAFEDDRFPAFRTADDAGQAMPGNANIGHDYGADLDEDARWALVEYLKGL